MPLRLGDTICGQLDFRMAQAPCYVVKVLLQSIESLVSAEGSQGMPDRVKVHGQRSLSTHNALSASFTLDISREAPAQMETELVRVRWQLHFEFVCAQQPHDRRGEERVEPLPAAHALTRTQWTLPLHVWPPSLTSAPQTRSTLLAALSSEGVKSAVA